jgi:hypothetical protein
MEKKLRVPIPESIQADVMFKSENLCCICRERGDHIHHVDGNPSNNKIENLVFLCFLHHDEAETKGGLRKKLSPKTILLYRNQLHKEIEVKRQNALKKFDKPIVGLSEETLFKASISAIIITELKKIEEEYFEATWKERDILLNKLSKYSDYTNYRVNSEIFNFLSSIGSSTRHRMPYEIASTLFSLIIHFYNRPSNIKDHKENIEIAKRAIKIGGNVAYDAGIYLKNIKVLLEGLFIIKYVYGIGKECKIKQITDFALQELEDLKHSFNRPERSDLENSRRLLEICRNDIDDYGLMYPKMPDDLYNLIISDKYK